MVPFVVDEKPKPAPETPRMTWRCKCGYSANLAHWTHCASCGSAKPIPREGQSSHDQKPE